MKAASRNLLLASFIVAVVLIGLVTWAGWRQFERVEATAALVTHTQEVLSRISRVLSLAQDVEVGSRGFVVTGDPAFLEPFEEAQATLDGELVGLCGVVEESPPQRASCAELAALIRKRVETSAATVALRRTKGFEAAQAAVASGTGKAVMDQIRDLTTRMEAEENRLLDQRTSTARFTARATNVQATAAIGLSLLLLIATFALVVRENLRRQQSEESLRVSEARYRQLFRSIDEGFCIVQVLFDPNGVPSDFRFLEINPSFEKQTGIRDALGKNARGLIPDLEQSWLDTYGRIAATGEAFRFVNEAKGLQRWFDVYAFRVGDPGERHVAILFSDITERRATEAKIARLNSDLQAHAAGLTAANRELESFSYSVSHDLRAPLRSIDGFSQVVLEDCGEQLNENGKDALKRVRKAARTMGELIDALLALSRVTRTELRRERIDLSAMAATIAGELRESNPDRSVEFVIAPGLEVEADPRLFRAMLTNLIGNAWKYSAQRDAARIEFGQTVRDGEAVYFVRDNGVGFDMAYVNKLFGAFQRLHNPSQYAGTGIGLATVQRILQRHGGRAWGEGVVDQGATFYFTVGNTDSTPLNPFVQENA